MIRVRFFDGIAIRAEANNKKEFVAVIPCVYSVRALFDELERALHVPFPISDWYDFSDAIDGMDWIKEDSIKIYHMGISSIEPSWESATYLARIVEIGTEQQVGDSDGKYVVFYFNNKEKVAIDKLFPGKPVAAEQKRILSIIRDKGFFE